jgi:hypothetical protein
MFMDLRILIFSISNKLESHAIFCLGWHKNIKDIDDTNNNTISSTSPPSPTFPIFLIFMFDLDMTEKI